MCSKKRHLLEPKFIMRSATSGLLRYDLALLIEGLTQFFDSWSFQLAMVPIDVCS